MNSPSQYTTGTAQADIEQALVAAGKDLDSLEPADLAMLEDYHTGGRLATAQLADLVGITADTRVLDAGTGIGGTARYLAGHFGCAVTAVDLVEEYCETARWLNHLVGLEDSIAVRRADVTALPFDDASYDIVFSQHVQMNVAQKDVLYQEARRILARNGQLAIWDIALGDDVDLAYPLPWADLPTHTHLATPAALRTTIESAGFTIHHWSDLTEQSAAMMQMIQSLPPSLLGLHAFVPDFPTRVKNLTQALATGHLRTIQAIAQAA